MPVRRLGFRQAVQPKACGLTAAHLQSPTLIMHCVDHLPSLVPKFVPRDAHSRDGIRENNLLRGALGIGRLRIGVIGIRVHRLVNR